MNRKQLIRTLAFFGALPIGSQALEAPASGATPAAPVGFGNPQNSMPPALRPPQADEATVGLVWQAVLSRFPEMVDGPERDGVFVVAMALRPDGQFVAGGMRYVDKPNQASAVQNELRDQLPMDVNGVAGMPFPTKGSAVPGGRVLKANVLLNVSMVPSNWDASRDKGIIRRAVMQSYADLFLSRNADHMNQLVVVMNEKGEIAQKKVVEVAVEHRGSMTMYKNLPVQATDFANLGLDADHVGVMGDFNLNMPMTMTRSSTVVPALGADGISRGGMPSFDTPMLMVRYAWPRREGEPVGGAPLAWSSIPRAEISREPMMKISQLAGKYFPAGSAPQGNWMVVTFNGEVLRTGHVDLGKNESLTNVYAERLMPGIKIASSMGMGIGNVSTEEKLGDPIGTPINITVFFLATDSPLPQPEEIRPVR